MSDERDDRPQCLGRTLRGTRCTKRALPGETRCAHHLFRIPGRPSKLTRELRDVVVYALVRGNYLEVAAQAAGIDKTTLYRWLRRAEDAEAKAQEHADPDKDGADLYDHVAPHDWPYLDFRHAVKSAEAFAESELLEQARSGVPGWQAPMTVLERRHPKRWGRRLDARVEHDGEVSRRVEIIAPTDDERGAVIRKLEESGVLPASRTPTDQEDPNA